MIMSETCLWMADNGGVFPVFVLPKAHAIADHMVAWAEDRPGDWFALCFAERQGRYAAVLFPNVVASVERFEAAHFASCGQRLRVTALDWLFRPISFVSGVRHAFKRVKKLIGSPSMVGFMEPGDFDPAVPASLDLDRIRRVGPFPVCWDARPFGFDIEAVLSQLFGSASDPGSN
jgi:hypothetical protein